MNSKSPLDKCSMFPVHQDRRRNSQMETNFLVNDYSVLQNYRKNFIDEAKSMLPARGTKVSQTNISQYFSEVKNLESQNSSSGTKRGKRTLEELQMKYDSLHNMVANLSDSNFITQKASSKPMTKIKEVRPSPRVEQNMPKINSTVKKIKVEADENNKINPKFIHLIGHVDNIMRWDPILKETNVYILYNMLGYFICAMDGLQKKEKFVFIKGKTGIIIECSYFEVDCLLPKITKNQFVGCVGHFIGPQKYRLFNISLLHSENHNDVQRAIFLSQRMAHELADRMSN